MKTAARGRAYLSAPGRLAGIDLARGLAVFGMFAAHLLALPLPQWADPGTWIGVAGGRSSILFATLAGVSLALITGAREPVTGEARVTASRRIAVRAGILWLFGILLIVTGVPVYVILPAYALLFLLALPLLGLPARTLWMLAGFGALLLPWVQPLWNALPMWQGVDGYDLSLFLGWHYPVTLWIVFLIAGLAIGRSPLRELQTQLWLILGGGAAIALAAVGAFFVHDPRSYLGAVWTASPHSGGILEVVGSGGSAVATIGLCLILCRTPVAAITYPLRAVGAMPLTAYVGQLLAWVILAAVWLDDIGDLSGFREREMFWPFVLGTLAFGTAWTSLFGRGPLERLIALCARTWVRPAPR